MNKFWGIGVSTALAALTLTGAAVGTAVADDRPGFEVNIFFDRNADGVQQENEPGYEKAEFKVRDVVHGHEGRWYTDANGKAFVPYGSGRWRVAYENPRLAATTPSVVIVEPPKDNKVVFGVRGASICGAVWLDANADGKRQAGEQGIAGHTITVAGQNRPTTSAADGSYCMEDIPTGVITLTSKDRSGIDGTAWGVADWKTEHPDLTQQSKFDVRDGLSRVWHIDTPDTKITGFDSAFVKAKDVDAKAVRIKLWTADGYYIKRPQELKVGDKIRVQGIYEVKGNVYDKHSATLTLPEGVKIVKTSGRVEGRKVIGEFRERRAPGTEVVEVLVEVEKVFTDGEVRLEAHQGLFGDVNPNNNVLAVKVGVVGAPTTQPTTTTTAPPTTTTTEQPKPKNLASTGASPLGTGVLGLGVLALGGVLFFAARRRRA